MSQKQELAGIALQSGTMIHGRRVAPASITEAVKETITDLNLWNNVSENVMV